MAFPIDPPIEPMLAKLAEALPTGDGYAFEPKWDGFRAIVFASADDVYIQSRDLRPLDRYFPELHTVFRERLPAGCVLDGDLDGFIKAYLMKKASGTLGQAVADEE